MTKITQQEFENYSNQFLPIFVRIMDTSEFKNESEDGQEKLKILFGLLLNQIRLGNVVALYNACEGSGIASKEDFSAIKRRVKEHIIARGYYNPASPLSLTQFRERRKKIMGDETWMQFWKNEERRYQLLLAMNEEDKHFIYRIFNFIEKGNKIFPNQEEHKWTEEEWQKIGFIWEDILKVFEEAHKKLEQSKQGDNTERERERERAPVVPLSLTFPNKITF